MTCLLSVALMAVLLYSCSGPSTIKLLLWHLGIKDSHAFHRVKAAHQHSGPIGEFDSWIYLEGRADQIAHVLSEQHFSPSGPLVESQYLQLVTFSKAPPPLPV